MEQTAVARLCQAEGAGWKDMIMTCGREWHMVMSGQIRKSLVDWEQSSNT